MTTRGRLSQLAVGLALLVLGTVVFLDANAWRPIRGRRDASVGGTDPAQAVEAPSADGRRSATGVPPPVEGSHDVAAAEVDRLRGIVVNMSGDPVSSARVLTDAAPSDGVVCDSQGRFAMPVDPKAPPERLLILHDAFRPKFEVLAADAPLQRELRIVLESGARVCIQVVDPSGGPIVGARVRLRGGHDGTTDGIVLGDDADRARYDLLQQLSGSHLREVESGVDGVACLDGLEADRYRLRAFHPDWRPATLESVDVGARDQIDCGRIVLDRGVELDGVVLDSEGGPAPDLIVESMFAFEYRTARSDVQGRFRFAGLPPDSAVGELRVRPPSGPAFWNPAQRLDAGPALLRLQPANHLELVLRDAGGAPPPDAEVRIQWSWPRGHLAPSLPASVSMRNGAARIDSICDLAIGFDLRVEGFFPQGVSLPEGGWRGALVRNVSLQAAAAILVDVVDAESGAPVAGAILELEREIAADDEGSDEDTLSFDGVTLADPALPDGSYALAAVHLPIAARVSMSVRAPGFRPSAPLRIKDPWIRPATDRLRVELARER